MSTYLTSVLRKRLEDADDHLCVYCQTSVGNTGQLLTIDHVNRSQQAGKPNLRTFVLPAAAATNSRAAQSPQKIL